MDKEKETLDVDPHQIYYVEYIKDWQDCTKGEKAQVIGTYYAELMLNEAVKEIKEEEFNKTVPPIKDDLKETLLGEMNEQEVEDLLPNQINWMPEKDDFYNDWDKIKGHAKNIMEHGEEYDEKENSSLYFMAHSNDKITGKPQLVDNVRISVPLVQLVIKAVKEGYGKNQITTDTKRIFFLDEKYDRRVDGWVKKTLSLDFWVYQIISEDKKYFIFSEKILPNEVCKITGMKIKIEDYAEMSRSLKVKSISKLFLLKECESNVKILSKEEIVAFTKEKKITSEDWIRYLGYHQHGNINRFPVEVENLRSSFILGGKVQGCPNHLFIMGRPGTKKTVGHLETIAYKFEEEPLIIEGADSRMKGLIPSFKEKPANIGYMAKANRMGWIDEIGKMIEFEASKHQSVNTNILGELNFLLEHKNRGVNSGNDNDCQVQATAKFMIPTNPVRNRSSIQAHVGLIDPTTLSRMIVWVQDDDETEFVMSSRGIEEIPPTPTNIDTLKVEEYKKKEEEILSREIVLGEICIGVGGTVSRKNPSNIMSRDEFLTIFDTCYGFVSDIDDEELQKLVDMSVNLAKEPMKSSVWRPRALHHVKLLIDGMCKHRCLFKDYNPDFKSNQEDYDAVERILVRMVNGWDTDLSPQDNI